MPDGLAVHYESPIGWIEIEGSEAGVSALNFVQPGKARTGRRSKEPLPAPLADGLAQLDEYFRGRRTVLSVKLDLRGTAFQKRVWAELFTDLLCWTRLGGLDHRKVLRSMELMRDKVIPRLRDSQPPPPPAL